MLTVLAVIGTVWIGPDAALSQERQAAKEDQKPTSPRTEQDYEIIRLKYASAVDLGKVLTEIVGKGELGIRIVVDPTTNALLVRCSPDDFARIKKLVSEIDVDRPPADRPAAQVSVYTLRHIAADRFLEDTLRLILQPPNGTFAIDPRLNQVIICADKRTQEVAQALLVRLDDEAAQKVQSVAEVQLRIVWLASGLTRKDAPKPPPDLQDVVDELAKIGVEDLRLVSQSVIKAMTEQQFTLAGSALLDSPCELSIKGTVSSRTGGDPAVQISIDATKEAKVGSVQTEDARRNVTKVLPVCRVGTTIVAPPGHSVVLGVTPTESLTSVFIVQVMPKAPPAKRPASRK
jgi:hypothetical protein